VNPLPEIGGVITLPLAMLGLEHVCAEKEVDS